MNRISQRDKFDNARRADDDELDINGPRAPLHKREPRSGQLVETFDEVREVKMPKLLFLERRFGWEK